MPFIDSKITMLVTEEQKEKSSPSLEKQLQRFIKLKLI